MLWTIVALSTVIAVLLYYSVRKSQSYWKKLGIKHSKPTFLFGDNLGTILRTENFLDLVDRLYKQFPEERYNGFYQFLQPLLLIRDPELIKQMTIKDFDHFVDRNSFITEEHDPLFGKNLLSLKGQKWRDMRATLSPSFTSSKMKIIFSLMSDVAENFIQHFKKLPEDVISVELKDVFSRYTNDVIATSAFGIKVDSLGEPDNEFYVMGKKITNFSSFLRNLKFMLMLMMPKVLEWLNISFLDEDQTTYFRNLVTETIKIREEKGIIRPDMLNLLMEARKGYQKQEEAATVDTGFATVEESDIGKGNITKRISDDDITAQALIFFFAGFESVSTMLCFMGYELAVNQDTQDNLRKEIKTTLEECNGKITYEVLMKMKFMDMVVTETLRKWPVAVGMDRVCTKPYTIHPQKPGEKPIHLPVGTVIFLPFYGIQRDPQYYPNPDKFSPDRFNDENKLNINPSTYLPFGIGPRNCIGSRFAIMEAKTLMFHILNNFKIVPTEKSTIPIKLSKTKINLSPDEGFWFGFQKL